MLPLTTCLLLTATPTTAPVAVLVEPGMVQYGGTPALGGNRLIDLLKRCGIEAEAVRADELNDPQRFSAERYTVLALTYGNAFPEPAFKAMQTFHQAGGCLALTGIPFCHPCVPAAPEGWRADGGSSWGNDQQWIEPGRNGGRAVQVKGSEGGWRGVSGPRLKATPGQMLHVSGWVRATGGQAGRDQLFVRFFRGDGFIAQDGPAAPADAGDWTPIEGDVTVPQDATHLDVSLQVWSAGTIDLDDVTLTVAGGTDNLLDNPGFERAGGEWLDRGHHDYFGHDANGIGTGSFLGPAGESGRFAVVQGEPLGLPADVARPGEVRPQWLDAKSLDPADEVVPLIEWRQADGATQPAAALIRHRCRQFNGAIDVWLGQTASGYDPEGRYAADQMLVRGIVECLKEKGKLDPAQAGTAMARLNGEAKLTPLPADLTPVNEPRPWGDTFFPKSKPPARELLAVDLAPLSPSQRLALICLQGLTSREQPRIWLIFGDRDRFWLQWHKDQGYIDGWQDVADWRELFRTFKSSFKGAAVADDQLYQGVLLATNLAAVEDLIVAPPELAKELGLEVRQDLRGRFTTYAEGMRWLWDTYHDRFSHHLCTYSHPVTAYNGALAYDIQWRGTMFWISGPLDGSRPGADSLAEMEVMARIFSQMPPNIGMRGFPWGGEGIGLGEGGGVDFCGGYGKGLVCTDHTPNLCVTSGVQIDHLTPPVQPPTPPLERDKVYIALTMSDGDNLNTLLEYFPDYFRHQAHGRFPVGWGMGPAALDLMPAVVQWYYLNAKPGDEFLADVSGIAYVFPQRYASRYHDPQAVLDGFLDWTGRYLQRLGMRTVRPHGGDLAKLERYADRLPFLHSIFADYARGVSGYDQAVGTLPGGMPYFRALTTWRYGKDGLLKEIREQVGDRRPAFVNAFLHNWTYDMPALERTFDGRDNDMVFVTPAQLADLYRQAVH